MPWNHNTQILFGTDLGLVSLLIATGDVLAIGMFVARQQDVGPSTSLKRREAKVTD